MIARKTEYIDKSTIYRKRKNMRSQTFVRSKKMIINDKYQDCCSFYNNDIDNNSVRPSSVYKKENRLVFGRTYRHTFDHRNGWNKVFDSTIGVHSYFCGYGA